MPTGVPKNGKRKSSPRVERISRVCEVCGKERFYTPGEICKREERGGVKIRFCSEYCNGKAKRKPDRYVELVCPICSKKFTKLIAHMKGKYYCSHACSYEGRRVENAKWRDPEQIKAYMAEYQRTNRERLVEQARLRDTKTPENHKRKLNRQRKYREANRDKINTHEALRRSKQIDGSFTAEEWASMKRMYDYTCLRCGKREPDIRLTIDHVVPLVEGGIHNKSNIQPLCKSCNSSKNAKAIDYREKFASKKIDIITQGSLWDNEEAI